MTGRIDPRSVLALAAAVLLWLAGPAAAETATGDVQLSDAWLTAKTKLALLADEDVSGSSINVDTSSAVVTLKGEVEDQAQKARALQIARGIEGVKQVQDHLTIKPTRSGSASTAQGGATTAPGASGVAKRDDDQIERDVRQAIQKSWTSGQLRMEGDTLKGAEGTSIEVDVDDGVVTLDGKVQSVEDIVKAAQAARGVQGVRSVKTNIESGQPS
ncbi:MAG TPA: BON domain-containing protein [Actinomycetota bacterium]|nr:BON domain-containing protein [Actinomycetota bacterium]